MSATLLSGMEIKEEILKEIKRETQSIKDRYHKVPGLVTILIGINPASLSYVKLKIKTANALGFKEIQENRPDNISEEDLLNLIQKYNRDESIHGILVQLPLPSHISEQKVINAIDPDKDVDGFHPLNAGRLLLGGGQLKFPPCTPAGIQKLIEKAEIDTDGAEVVVVGRSNIVGKPIANLMMQKTGGNATVTLVHTGTRNLASHCQRADILIVAAGVPNLVKTEWIKPGACIIDVGVNRVGEKVNEKTGKKTALLKGDVDFNTAQKIASYITPVPGGVGPMTIAMLMQNTLNALKFKLEI